jgi:tetratricopeptide (TPR) repeat protein
MTKQKKEQPSKRQREKVRRKHLSEHRDDFVSRVEEDVLSAHIICTEIHQEYSPMDPPLSPENDDKAAEALEVAKKNNLAKAIQMLTEINAEEPGRPSVLYNIAVFQDALGEHDLYDETIDKLIEECPDYLFGQVAHAKRLIALHRLDEAWSILSQFYRQKRLHVTEFSALSAATILYHLAKDDMQAAKSIHQSAKEVCDSFPSWDSFEIDLLRIRLYYGFVKGGTKKRKTRKTPSQ